MKETIILLITTIALAFIFCIGECVSQKFMVAIYRLVTMVAIPRVIAKWSTT